MYVIGINDGVTLEFNGVYISWPVLECPWFSNPSSCTCGDTGSSYSRSSGQHRTVRDVETSDDGRRRENSTSNDNRTRHSERCTAGELRNGDISKCGRSCVSLQHTCQDRWLSLGLTLCRCRNLCLVCNQHRMILCTHSHTPLLLKVCDEVGIPDTHTRISLHREWHHHGNRSVDTHTCTCLLALSLPGRLDKNRGHTYRAFLFH